jgi:hypothetical protein
MNQRIDDPRERAGGRQEPRSIGDARRARLVLVVGAWLSTAAIGAACQRPAPLPPAIPIPEPLAPAISRWPATLGEALRAAEVGRFDDAEEILTGFSVEHAGTPDGAESDFWRALLKTDPANRKATPRESMALYDAYLSGGAALPRYAEALILRRVVEALDSTRTLLATVRASADAREKARDEEIRRLNDVVDRTTAELERIKRRLIPRPQ